MTGSDFNALPGIGTMLAVIGIGAFLCFGLGWSIRPDTPCPRYTTVEIETMKGNKLNLYIAEEDIPKFFDYSHEGIKNLNFRVPRK